MEIRRLEMSVDRMEFAKCRNSEEDEKKNWTLFTTNTNLPAAEFELWTAIVVIHCFARLICMDD